MPCTPYVNGDFSLQSQGSDSTKSGHWVRSRDERHQPATDARPGPMAVTAMTTSWCARLGSCDPRRARKNTPALIMVRFLPRRLMVQLATLNPMLHNTKPALRQCVLGRSGLLGRIGSPGAPICESPFACPALFCRCSRRIFSRHLETRARSLRERTQIARRLSQRPRKSRPCRLLNRCFRIAMFVRCGWPGLL